jgi:hypothetical protein
MQALGFNNALNQPFAPQPSLALSPMPGTPAAQGGPQGQGQGQATQATTTPPRPSLGFVANPLKISAGETSQLRWIAFRATECVVALPGGEIVHRGGTEGTVTTPTLIKTTRFTLTCGGAGGTKQTAVTVYIGEEPPASAKNAPTQPTPTITVTYSAPSTSSSPPSSGSGSTPVNNYCDPGGMSMDAFITCLQQLPK